MIINKIWISLTEMEKKTFMSQNTMQLQSQEKEKREAELILANKELAFQNEEKEKRAAELILANKELVFQNKQKEKRAAEMILAKEYERKLTALNVKLSSITDTIYDTLYTLDVNGVIQSVNKAAVKNLGYSEQEMIGACAHDLFHYEYQDAKKVSADQCAIHTAIKELKSYFGEQKFIKKDGTLIDVEISSNPLIIDNKMIGSVTVCRDIKIQKEALKLLEDAKSLAEESNRLKSDFLANMSHEIRTPMNAVMGLSKLLLDTPLLEMQKNYAENIYKSSNALLDILNEILDFSKIEANRLEIENYPFQTQELMEQINILFGVAATQKNLELIFDIEPNVPEVIDGDKMRLSQVIGNLVGNAIKFTQKGAIHIRVDTLFDKEKTFLEIFVRDTGIGIDEEKLKKLFQPFVQADSSTTRKYGGTGLGLVISKKLVELMGGEIKVISTLGKGSTFSFKVPLSKTREKNIVKHSYDLKVSTYNNSYLSFIAPIKNKRVLLVEDNETNRIVARGFLEKMGLIITIAEDGQIALDKVAQEDFDLILMDIQMPNMNGLEAAKKLRRNGFKKPIIAMTAAAMQSDKDATKQAGMDDHVAKPIDDEELAFTLLRYLDAEAYLNIQKELGHSTRVKKKEDEKFTFEGVKEHLSGDENLMQKSLSAFSYDLQTIEDDFKKAMVSKDVESFKALAHKIQGAAGNLKALKLQKLAQEYEVNLKDENEASNRTLLQELASVRKLTDKFLSQLQEIPKKTYELKIEELSECIRTISQKLKKHRLLDDETVQTLLQNGIDTTLYDKLSHQINAFDYASAQETLQVIASKYGVIYE